jgi:4-amino-4-deoxy-L-arabinose transferase-like glycosyltransferase
MPRHMSFFAWLLLACLLLRLPAMFWLPLLDTSEPRYAEIARLMLEKNDWITLWFIPELPFWGKPPLAFWCQALSMKLFGVTEFGARLPGWLAILAAAAVLWRLTIALHDKSTARIAVLAFCTMGLSYLGGAAVLTDPFLTLGTTLTLSGILMAGRGEGKGWTFALFSGLTVSLLAKGPVGLVIVAFPTIATALFDGDLRQRLRTTPWSTGLACVLITTLPWYIAAEIKTPGFLDYFIVGEHVMRFLDSGWQGDLYGSAHDRAHGTIWLYGLQATFPWGLLLLASSAALLWKHRYQPTRLLRNCSGTTLFLILWALVCGLFFTPAGNILWTYWMPSLPAIAILVARVSGSLLTRHRLATAVLSLLIPATAAGITVAAITRHDHLKTEKYILEYADSIMRADDRIVYLNKLPFSARFYSQGHVAAVGQSDLPRILPGIRGRCLLVTADELPATAFVDALRPTASGVRSRDYRLYVIEPDSPLWHALATPADIGTIEIAASPVQNQPLAVLGGRAADGQEQMHGDGG